MKKHITTLIVILILTLTVGGCNSVNKDSDYNDSGTDSAFVLVKSGSRLTIYKDNKTDVLYVAYHAGYKGGISVMLDTDGKPLTYENWK